MAENQELAVFSFLIGLVISTILIRKLLKLKNPPRDRRRQPPSPMGLPIVGHLHLLSSIPHQSLAKLSSLYGGDLIKIRLGSVPCVVVSSAEMAREFLKTHETSFLDRPQTIATDFLTYGSKDFSFAPYGPYWKFMKKLCMTQLLGGQTLDLLKPVRRIELKRLVDFLTHKANDGQYADLGRELLRMNNNVISSMIMSQRCSNEEEESKEVREIIGECLQMSGKFNISDYVWFCKYLDVQGFGKRMKAVRDRFDGLMEKIIQEHQNERTLKMKQRGSMDLLHILLDIMEGDQGHVDMELTLENIKSFVLDLFLAGTDTSAITTEWAMAELINHPNILKKAAQEIDSVVGKNRLIEESDVPQLPYLQAIVKETLRLHPAGPLIPRKSSEECVVSGYHIPAKTHLFVNVWAIHRDPNHWEDPLEFRPERFLTTEDGQPKLDVRGQQHYHYLPFGSGRRGCPGTSMGMQTVQTTLGALVQCFVWRVEKGEGGVDMEEGPGLTLPRAHPLVCMPVSRFCTLICDAQNE